MNLLLFITAALVMGIALEGLLARLGIPWSAGPVVGFVASETAWPSSPSSCRPPPCRCCCAA